MTTEHHTRLTCAVSQCQSILAFLPGTWRVVRELDIGEKARPGYAAFECKERQCRTRWEAEQVTERPTDTRAHTEVGGC